MKKLVVGLVLALCALVVPMQAQTVPDATAVRASAILTGSDVLSTFTLPGAGSGTAYLNAYVPFTVGSLTSAYVWPCGSMDGNPLSTGYYKSLETSLTLTATGSYLYRIPLSAFGSGKYGGFLVKGTGTATSSAIGISVRQERR